MKTRNLLLISAACLLSNLSSSAQTIPSYIPANGLVGWWPFNGNANDESGNGNNGTVNGATLTADRFGSVGKAYSFQNSSISLPTTLQQGFGTSNLTQFSFSCWFKNNDSVFIQPSSIVGGRNSNGSNYTGLHPWPGTKRIRWYVNGATTNLSESNSSNIVFENIKVWNHIVGTFRGGTVPKLFLFYNGIMVDSAAFQVPLSWVQTNQFNLGIDAFYPRYFTGSLDDIAIWNRALSAQEISNLYQSSSPGGGGTAGGSKAFPKGISYQAIARNAQAQPLLNTALQLRFTILSDSINGSSEYVETQALSSNAQGLINTSIGNGTAQSGSWAAINWSAGRKFLRAEINAGSGFVNLGTQEMLSVPFSQRSKSADAIENSGLPVYGSNAEAISAGLKAGQMYRTAAGVLMVVY